MLCTTSEANQRNIIPIKNPDGLGQGKITIKQSNNVHCSKDMKKIVIIVLIGLLIYSFWSKHQQKQQFKDNIDILNDSISTYELKTGDLVAEKEVLQTSNKDIKDQLYIKDSTLSLLVQKYRKVQSTTTVNTVTKIDSILIRAKSLDSLNFEFSHNAKWFDISGSYNDERLLIDSLTLPNTQNIVIGVKKGLFNRTVTTSVVNSNPYIKTTGMNTQVTSIKNRRWGVGVFGGIDVTGSPTVGIGLTWSLIQF